MSLRRWFPEQISRVTGCNLSQTGQTNVLPKNTKGRAMLIRECQRFWRRSVVWLIVFVASFSSFGPRADEQAPHSSAEKTETKVLDAAAKRRLKDVVRLAYTATHDGWSTDEVILQDELNRKFLAVCKERMPEISAFDCNWMLMTLRKAGDLSDVSATKRKTQRHDDYLHAAEVAARFLEDKHRTNTDHVLCDPMMRAEFDKLARSIAPETDAYRLRKAALALRKSRRLPPELVLRVAKWEKEVLALSAAKIVENPRQVSDGPGVYIFRDATGYLYIGESSQLRTRVSKHLDRSDRQSLANYLAENGIKDVTVELHVFDAQSDAKDKALRRAYESDLIRSRKPRFNLAP